MSKSLKKGLKAAAILAGATVLVLLIAGGMAKSSPSFYRPPRLDAPEFEASAKRMEDKLIEIRNLAAETQASQGRGQVSEARYVVTITQDELNAFMLKWAELNALRDQFERFARDPMVAFEPGRVILAARTSLGPFDSVVSLYARVERDGDQINLAVEKLRAGRLTLPEAVWSEPRQRLVSELERLLPQWGAGARFDRAGVANEAAAKAMYGRLLLSALNGQPADGRAIIPVSSNRGIAVRIVDMQTASGQITLTMKPLNAAEREAYLAELRSPK